MTVTSTAAGSDADAIAAAVLRCPAVVRMADGIGAITTYLPGRRVSGVRIGDDAITLEVVTRYGVSVAEAAEQIREAVRAVAAGLPVHVRVADVEVLVSDGPVSAGDRDPTS